jgi:hypothetical protein
MRVFLPFRFVLPFPDGGHDLKSTLTLGRDHHLERHADDKIPDLEAALVRLILQLRVGMRVDYPLEYSVSLMFESKDLDEFRTRCKIVLGETLAAWGVRPSLNKGHQTKSRNVDGSGIACDRR